MGRIRRTARLGTSGSVLQDLQASRSSGGLLGATASDLAGTIEFLRQLDPAADSGDLLLRARELLGEAAAEIVAKYEGDEQSDRLRIGAIAVEQVLLGDRVEPGRVGVKRNDIAARFHCGPRSVRNWEDEILGHIAGLAWTRLRHQSPPRLEGTGQDAPSEVARQGRVLAVVTGTSGTGVFESLERFTKQRGIVLLQLERELVDLGDECFPVAVVPNEQKRDKLLRLLGLPEPILQDLWSEAWTRLVQAVNNEIAAGADVIVSLHATYRHGKSQSVVSLVGPSLDPSPEWTPRIVVQLVDDIYDCLARLARRRTGAFFLDFDNGASVISLLVRLLNWRESETLVSKQIAKALSQGKYEVPFAVFGVKHPVTTFERLLRLPPDRFAYLSHRIDQADDGLRSEIDALAEELRDNDDVVLFEPTTIDELRFLKDANGVVASLELRPRWIDAGDGPGDTELLWAPLDTEEMAFARQPFQKANSRRDVARVRPAMLIPLKELVEDQVKARDLQMVQQCSHVLCYRPFVAPDGSFAGGVEAECAHHLELADHEVKTQESLRTPPLVAHTVDDERRRREGALLNELRPQSGDLLRFAGLAPVLDDIRELVGAKKLKKALDQLALLTIGGDEPSDYELGDLVEARLLPTLPKKCRPYFGRTPSLAVLKKGNEPAYRSPDLAEVGSRLRAVVLGVVSEMPHSMETFRLARVEVYSRFDAAELAQAFAAHTKNAGA